MWVEYIPWPGGPILIWFRSDDGIYEKIRTFASILKTTEISDNIIPEQWINYYYKVKATAKASVELVRNTLTGNRPSIEHVVRANMSQDKWIPPALPIYAKPEFYPPYQLGGDSVSRAINSIIEIRALWEYVIKDAYYIYSEIYSQLSNPITNTVIEICKKHKQAFAVYDKKTRTWLIESNEPMYKYCYNGTDFEAFDAAKDKIGGNRLLLVGQYTTLMQEPNLLRTTRTALTMKFYNMPDIRLIAGVPGCGKTSFIIKNHSVGSLVLTSCTEGAEDIRSRMGKINNCESSKFRKLYRTVDSYLLNSRCPAHHVWMDEALMEHPGKIFLVCLFSRCDRLFLLGDSNQLGYVNRVNDIELIYDKSSIFFRPAITLSISYRCPVDVMAVLSSKYEGGTYSMSTVLRSMTCKPFTSLEDVPKRNETKYLVFRQAEKKIMRSKGYNVSTIHEFQGKEAKNVVIVRMSWSLRGWPYDSPAHILVGLSRHTESLVYYTPITDDLKILITTPFTDGELQRHMAYECQDTIPKRPITITSKADGLKQRYTTPLRYDTTPFTDGELQRHMAPNSQDTIPKRPITIPSKADGLKQRYTTPLRYDTTPFTDGELRRHMAPNSQDTIPKSPITIPSKADGLKQRYTTPLRHDTRSFDEEIRRYMASNRYSTSNLPGEIRWDRLEDGNHRSQTPRTHPSFIGTIMRGIAYYLATSIFRSVVNLL